MQPTDEIGTYLDNLVTERQRAWNEANELTERAQRERREQTAEERSKWDRIAGVGGALDTLDEQIRDFSERRFRDREHDELRSQWAPIVRPVESRVNPSNDSFDSFLRGAPGNVSNRVYEMDFGAAVRERSALRAGLTGAEFRTNLNVTTTTAGKNTVPTDFVRRLYDYMEAASGIRKTNVTIIATSGGEPIQVPTVTGHGTAAIVSEGTALAAADPSFGQVTLGAFKYGQLTQITNELLSDSGVDITGWLAKDFGRSIGRATGSAYFNGSGTNAPHGVASRAGTATTIQTSSTGVPSYNNLVDVQYSVIEEYRQNGAQWLMSDNFEAAIRKLTDTQGRPLWQPMIQVGEPDLLLGYPIIDDRNFSSVGTAAGTPAMFGDFSAFAIRDAGVVRIERSDDFAFSSDVVTYRCILRTDSDMIDVTGGALKILKAPTT
jgi:HK97 family phage major capsid protein